MMQPQSPENIATCCKSRTLSKGELWLGTEVLARAGFDDSVDNHLRLADQLGHDVVCFPVTMETAQKQGLGYRYFSWAALQTAIGTANQMVAAVVDGPFQELVTERGLAAVATDWFRQRRELRSAYASKQIQILELIRQCLEQGVGLVVIADDLATQQGPLFSSNDIKLLCGEFYTRATKLIHAAKAKAFWHCCGKITSLAPLLKNWRLDGLAAVQHHANNLLTLDKALDGSLVLMAGIENELLDTDPPSQTAVGALKRIITTLAPTGRLILSSGCGLYRGDYLTRIKKIYAMVDELLTRD